MSQNLMVVRGPRKVCFLEQARYFRNMKRMARESGGPDFAAPTEHYIKLVEGKYTVHFIDGYWREVLSWRPEAWREFTRGNWVELPCQPEFAPRPEGWNPYV